MTTITAADLASRIKEGELPSAALRYVLSLNSEWDKNDAGHLLCEAFDESELIYYIWNWKESKKSDALDTQFDVHVIGTLLRNGLPLPWGEEYCRSEFNRVKAILDAAAIAERQAAIEAVTFEHLLELTLAFEGMPVCFQALWDGDSRGWHIGLSVIVRRNNIYEQKHLGVLKFGGDARLFNGTVPPWPEAVAARDVGNRLAARFDAQFYFPSPEAPNDSMPTWLEATSAT